MMSREKAIEYFKHLREMFCESYLKIYPKNSIGYQATLKEKEFYDIAIKALEQQPKTEFADCCRECAVSSATQLLKYTKQYHQWMSCSEKMPKAGEYIGDAPKYYLVQNKYGDMMVARYTHSEYWEQKNKLNPIADEIVAWRELPVPYKTESEV